MTERLQWLYRIQPVRPAMLTDGPTPDEAEIVSQHFRYLNDLTEQGVVLMVGRTQTTDFASFGIIIFYAETETLAWKLVHDDPAVKQRVMRAELYPYRISLMGKYDG